MYLSSAVCMTCVCMRSIFYELGGKVDNLRICTEIVEYGFHDSTKKFNKISVNFHIF